MCLTFHVTLGLHVPELSLASVYAFMVGTTAHRTLTKGPASRLSQFGSFAARSGGLAMIADLHGNIHNLLVCWVEAKPLHCTVKVLKMEYESIFHL